MKYQVITTFQTQGTPRINTRHRYCATLKDARAEVKILNSSHGATLRLKDKAILR